MGRPKCKRQKGIAFPYPAERQNRAMRNAMILQEPGRKPPEGKVALMDTRTKTAALVACLAAFVNRRSPLLLNRKTGG